VRTNFKLPMMLIAAFFAATIFAPLQAARADGTSLKVATCDPLKVLMQIQEYKDSNDKFKAEENSLQQELNNRKTKLQSMQDQLKLIMPDSPQYADQNQQFLQYNYETEAWFRVMSDEMVRKDKTRAKEMFDKVQAAIADICKDRGIDLVVSTFAPEVTDPEKVDPQNYRYLLLQRALLYSDPKLDITQDVIVAMDKTYNNGK
jgi:Skp family chaperone for outer membrane proteins